MKNFFRDQRGGVVILSAMLFPTLLGFSALSVDVANLYYNKTKIQMAAEAAALGAVLSLPNTTAATTQALDLLGKNAPTNFGTLSTSQDITTGYWNASTKTFTAGAGSVNAVKVVTHRSVANGNPVQTYFGKFVGSPQVDLSAQSIAVRFSGACVRVLDPSASQAFYDSGNGSVTMNCPLQINSSSSNAARTQGSSSVSASEICITGSYSGNGWSPTPKTGCTPISDPLAGIPEPSMPPASCGAPNSSGVMASNCVITGSVSFSGSVTLQSGTYYLRSANVTVSNNSTLTGSGVMIFVDQNSTLSLLGGGTISLSAATSGTYAGILIFQSRSTPVTTTLSIGGGGTLSLNGTLYVPSATLSIGGNGSYSSAANFGYLISDKLTLGGSSNFVFNAFPTSGATPRTLRVHAGLVS
jgi:Flp pilus assembly protein TadG